MKDFKVFRWFYCILAALVILLPVLSLAGVTTVNHGAGSANAVSVDAMGGGLYVKVVGPGAYNGSATQGSYAVEYQPAAPLFAGNLLQVSFTGAAFDGSAINVCGIISGYASGVPAAGTGLFNFVLTNGIGAGNFLYFTNGSCNAQPGSYGLPVKLLATTNSAWTTVKVDAVSAANILIDPSSAANLVWISPSSNTATIFTEYAIPTAGSFPYEITAGPDGNLWFTEYIAGKIGKITTAGVFTEYVVASAPLGIASGPDGNLWFAGYTSDNIGKITTAGVTTLYALAGGSWPVDIISGPDGNLWFTEQSSNKIGKITTAGVITEYAIPTAGSQPHEITSGPDGNLWFTEYNGNKIGKITIAGVITEYVVPTGGSGPHDITSGSDGNLWFGEYLGNKIGKITTAGVITEYAVPTAGSNPYGITSGPDGNLWFTEYIGNKIGMITTAGVITEYVVPTAGGNPIGITSGPDGNLWFVEYNSNKIGKLALKGLISAAPTSNYFGNANVGATSAANAIFTITNTGTASLVVGAVAIPAVGNYMDFAITANSCSNTTFASAGNCTLQATFTPTAGGARNANIQIPSNDPVSPLYNIPLSGTGQYTLTVAKTGAGAGNVTSAPAGIDCGATCSAAFNGGTVVTLTAAAAVNSTFTGWTGGGCAGTGTCSITMNAATNTTADFAAANVTYTVTPSAGAGGTISPNTPQTINSGSTTSFTVTMNAGYTASVGGTCGGSLVGNTYTTNAITANCTVVASFTINTYTVTPSAGTGGTISPSTPQTVNYGSTTAFTVTPITGYTTSSVTGCGGALTGSTYTTGAITANCTVTATFAAANFTITASAGTGGSISPSGAANVVSGSSQTYTITPNAGYKISDVLVDSSSVGTVTSYTFSNVTANHTISATFAPNTFTITASAGTGGSISPSGAANVVSGSSQTYTITPNAGYKISDVLVDSATVGPVTSYTFSTVTANHTISATFAPDTFTITASAGIGGSISCSPTTVNSGSSSNCAITTNTGFKILDVSVDGASAGAITSYTFSNVTANHSISATFAPNTYTITASAGTGGSISPSSAMVNSGSTTAFTVTPDTGYSISSVTGCGGTLTGNTYTTGPITANCAVSASFSANPVNGVCGSSSGGIFTTAPAGNLCSTGTASSVSGSGPWTWNCNGANGGTNANCFANLQSYTVSTSAGTGGSISCTPTTVSSGSNSICTLTTDAGYNIASVTGCGGTLSGNTYTTEPITTDCSVSATFKTTFTITTPSGPIEVAPGGSFTISTAGASNVIVDGVSIGAVNVVTFINITGPHTITW